MQLIKISPDFFGLIFLFRVLQNINNLSIFTSVHEKKFTYLYIYSYIKFIFASDLNKYAL